MNPLNLSTGLVAVLLSTITGLPAATPHWPQFRGPNGSGVSEAGRPPIHFGPDTNLLWKMVVPPGVSSPVVWGNYLFLTAYASNQLLTLACDAATGRELWRRVAPAEKIEKCHVFSSPAAPTPCTDGERVIAYFGSFGLLAYDFQGKELWRRPFATLLIPHGPTSSPILASGRLILQRDGNSTNAQLIALDPATGRTLWETPRPLVGTGFSTPMLWGHDGIEELIVQGRGRLAAYDLARGKLQWWVKGWGFQPIPTPVVGEGLLFVGGGFSSNDPAEPTDPLLMWENLIQYDANQDGQLAMEELPADLVWHIRKELPKDLTDNYLTIRTYLRLYVDENKDNMITKAEWDAADAAAKDQDRADRLVGIRPGGKGDSSKTHLVWETTRGLMEIPTALFYRGRLYIVRNGGMWTVIEPKTGARLLDRERIGIGGQAVASPIAANGHIYVVNEAGTCAVLRIGDQLDVAAVNKLGEIVRATPAIEGDTLFVRSAEHLWAFGEKEVHARK